MTESSDVAELTVLDTEVLLGIGDVFSLLLDNRIVLIADELLFFLKVRHDLLETAFKDLNLSLIDLNFLSLAFSSGLVLVLGSGVERDVSLEVLVKCFLTSDLSLEIIDSVALRDGLLGQLLVFQVNALLDLLDVTLSFLRGLLFENFNLLIEVRLNGSLFTSQFDLVLILGLCDLVGQFSAGQLPLVDLSLVDLLLPLELFHGQNLFLKLLDLDLSILLLNFTFDVNLLDFSGHLSLSF